jgi:hypothetical protein
MAFDEAWRLRIDMCAHDGKGLAKNLGHCPNGAALGEASGVDAKPGGK